MKCTMRLILLVVLVSVIVIQNHGADALLKGFWRRCKKTDCVWGPWSSWRGCSKNCGPHGVQSRYRNVAKKATCGGAPCHGYAEQDRACNRRCFNNGRMVKGQCACPKNYQGACCQTKRKFFRGREVSDKDDVLNEIFHNQ